MPIRARIPASNFTKSLSMPSLKITPPVGICETMSNVSQPVIAPQMIVPMLERLVNGSRTLNRSSRAVASKA